MNNGKVLVVEDDKGITDFLIPELEHEGFEVMCASDGRSSLELFENNEFDIILLDIMIPNLNGMEVLRRIRKKSNVPVIMITARRETLDKVNGLDAGADDYLVKPFEIEELFARMRAVIRRKDSSSALPIKFRALTLEPSSMEVTLNKEKIELSKTEYLLLKTLLEHKNVVMSRNEILDAVWGKNHFIDENSVDVYMRHLRSKIDEKAGEEYISTVRGAGYVIRKDVNET